MGKPIKQGFSQYDFEVVGKPQQLEMDDRVMLTLARLLGFDADNERFVIIQSDDDGRLLVSSGATQTKTVVNSSASATTTSSNILADNNDRKQYMVQNLGASPVYIELDSAAVVATGIEIPVDGVFIDDVYTGIVSAITSTGTADLRIVEWS